MALAKAREGFSRRRVAGGGSGKAGASRVAVAWVVRASEAYLGLATKVRWPEVAVSRPETPVMRAVGSPWRVALRCLASSASVRDGMGWIVIPGRLKFPGCGVPRLL